MDTLYISDLDGTLLGADSNISPRSRSLLNEAIAGGAAFTIATARTPATVSPLLSGVGLQLPAIVMTGAAMWNPSTGLYSDIRYIAPSTVRSLLQIYEREGLPTFLYQLVGNHIEIHHLGPMSEQEKEFMNLRLGNPFKTFHIPRGTEDRGLTAKSLPLDNVILLFAMQEEPVVRRTAEAIAKANLPCNPLHYHDTYGPESELMEVFGPGATKGEAVEHLRQITGARRVVVFGDNVNDIPMMRKADVAIAVENAVDEVKGMADLVIGPNTEDSVARFLYEDSRKTLN